MKTAEIHEDTLSRYGESGLSRYRVSPAYIPAGVPCVYNMKPCVIDYGQLRFIWCNNPVSAAHWGLNMSVSLTPLTRVSTGRKLTHHTETHVHV